MGFWQILKTLATLVRGHRRYKKNMGRISTASLHLATTQAVLAAYRKGEYEEALQALEPIKDAQETELAASYFFFSGTMLLNLGRLDEAEQRLRRHLTLAIDDRRKALAYSSLGQLLVETQRYDEAMECFETSLRCWPDRGSCHRAIAEIGLRRGGRASDARRSAQLGVEKDQARMSPGDSQETREAYDISLAEDLATLAWAVAADSHDHAEVERLVGEAVKLSANAVAPAALVHCQCGQAYLTLGDIRQAEQHFSEAVCIDPNGMWGRTARTMVAGVHG